MAKGISVFNGSQHIHRLLDNGTASFSGSVEITGSLLPQGDGARTIGSDNNRWADIFALQTTVGAIFENGLETKGISELETGTVLCWHDGKLSACSHQEDPLVMGVSLKGKDQPIILGAEYILATGDIKEGDFLVTSSKIGHAMSIQTDQPWLYMGKIIGQALENSSGDSKLIKCMISKR